MGGQIPCDKNLPEEGRGQTYLRHFNWVSCLDPFLFMYAENSNSKTLFYKECTLSSAKNLYVCTERERDIDRNRESETDRDREREKEKKIVW